MFNSVPKYSPPPSPPPPFSTLKYQYCIPDCILYTREFSIQRFLSNIFYIMYTLQQSWWVNQNIQLRIQDKNKNQRWWQALAVSASCFSEKTHSASPLLKNTALLRYLKIHTSASPLHFFAKNFNIFYKYKINYALFVYLLYFILYTSVWIQTPIVYVWHSWHQSAKTAKSAKFVYIFSLSGLSCYTANFYFDYRLAFFKSWYISPTSVDLALQLKLLVLVEWSGVRAAHVAQVVFQYLGRVRLL